MSWDLIDDKGLAPGRAGKDHSQQKEEQGQSPWGGKELATFDELRKVQMAGS